MVWVNTVGECECRRADRRPADCLRSDNVTWHRDRHNGPIGWSLEITMDNDAASSLQGQRPVNQSVWYYGLELPVIISFNKPFLCPLTLVLFLFSFLSRIPQIYYIRKPIIACKQSWILLAENMRALSPAMIRIHQNWHRKIAALATWTHNNSWPRSSETVIGSNWRKNMQKPWKNMVNPKRNCEPKSRNCWR